MDITGNKNRFLKIFENYVDRPGKDQYLSMLERTDFFTAPASTKYHSNEKGGLCGHSLGTFDSIIDILTIKASLIPGMGISDLSERLKNGEVLSPGDLDRVESAVVEVFGTGVSLASLVVTGLCHDAHKINFYEFYEKSVYGGLDPKGKKIWSSEPAWRVREDVLVLGDSGTNSNYIIQSYMKLTYLEMLAIENHHGFNISGVMQPSASKAWSKSKLALYLHLADMDAAYGKESKDSE